MSMEEVFVGMLSFSIFSFVLGGLAYLLVQTIRNIIYMSKLKKVDLNKVIVFATKNGRPTILQDIENKNILIKL